MGAGNVTLVLIRWSPVLDDKPFRALIQMSLTSLDGDDPPRYWGGWAPLARAVGATFLDDCDRPKHKPCKGCQAARRAVARAVKSLTESGLIETTVAPRLGVNAEYTLWIKRGRVVDNGPSRYGSGPQRVTLSVARTSDAERHTDVRRSASPLNDAERHTEEYQEEASGIETGDNSAQATTSPAPVVDEPSCDVCRWMAWEGHAPGCRNGSSGRTAVTR